MVAVSRPAAMRCVDARSKLGRMAAYKRPCRLEDLAYRRSLARLVKLAASCRYRGCCVRGV